jgi:serine/threonine-protein kinase
VADLELSSYGDFLLGEWVVQPRLSRITHGDQVERLEPRCMDLLVFLSRHPDEVHSRQRIIDEVWRVEAIAENTLTHAIAELRKALGDDAQDPRYIETIHRRGYRLLVRPGTVSEEQSSASRTVSHFILLEHLGSGGMGVVYRAHDRRLDREVAIKVLPEEVAQDEDRLARFEREAKLLASLNHQNIATLHGLEEHRGQRFLVMELVEGETLAGRIEKGPLPFDDALDIAFQITEGLEAAHGRGVIHRDLKPANVMVDSDGGVKVLDFGLAKAFDPEDSGPQSPESLAESPTLTAGLTRGDVLLGTAAYMSPEQARGRPVDKRADIWAFGCVLYEMLTGSRAFAGATATEILAAIIKEEPDWENLPAETSAPVRRLLRRCLTKDPRDRFHDIADVRIELQSLATDDAETFETLPSVQTRDGWRARLPWSLIAIFAVVAGALILGALRKPPSGAVTIMLLGLEPAERLGSFYGTGIEILGLHGRSFDISTDGRVLVFLARDDTGSRLYRRALDEARATPIPGTEDAHSLFISPDAEWIGFWADGSIKKVRTEGGPTMSVCDARLPPWGASWGPNDTIVFGQHNGGILQVPGDGGEPKEITELAGGETGHWHPRFLPDKETLLFTTRKKAGDWEDTAIVAQSIISGKRTTLVENGADARYAPTGHLVYVRLGTLVAVPFDLKRLEVTGSAVVVQDSVRQTVNAGPYALDTYGGLYTLSDSGTLVLVTGGVWADERTSIVWVDRKGRAEPVSFPPGIYSAPRFSPDGTRVAVQSSGFDDGNDIWVYEISRGTLTRLTIEESRESLPAWTPDGARITFASDRSGDESIYWAQADGSGAAELVLAREGCRVSPAAWSSDGRNLVFLQSCEVGSGGIWAMPLGGEPQPFIESPHHETWPTFSPDGRWLAYGSGQEVLGRYEVFVTPFPGPGPRIQISTDGGREPAWARDGRELFFRGPSSGDGMGSMWAVDITTEPELSVGRPRELFRDEYQPNFMLRAYDVSPDGQMFVMQKHHPRSEEPVTHLNVTLNWFEELKRLAPPER